MFLYSIVYFVEQENLLLYMLHAVNNWILEFRNEIISNHPMIEGYDSYSYARNGCNTKITETTNYNCCNFL
jgi:hypothetical protein